MAEREHELGRKRMKTYLFKNVKIVPGGRDWLDTLWFCFFFLDNHKNMTFLSHSFQSVGCGRRRSTTLFCLALNLLVTYFTYFLSSFSDIRATQQKKLKPLSYRTEGNQQKSCLILWDCDVSKEVTFIVLSYWVWKVAGINYPN